MPSISGDISLMRVGDVFLWVANRKLSVTVSMSEGSVDRRFVVRGGGVSQSTCSDPREYLGQHLINFGYITEEQLQKAFDTQQETHVPLGRVLEMVDAITHEQLARVLLFKTREALLEAMCWRAGAFRVTTEVSDDTELDTEVPVNLLEVHSEGIARLRMWDEIRRVFPTDGTRCDVLAAEGTKASSFDLRLLSLLEQGQSVGEVSLELRAMDFPIYARLYDLYNRKLIMPRLQSTRVGGAVPPRASPAPAARLLEDLALDLEEAVDDAEIVEDLDLLGAVVEVPEPGRSRRSGGEYAIVRPERPAEAPGVAVPAEADDPQSALRIALAGRSWNEALILAERILQLEPTHAEAMASHRVAEGHVRRLAQTAGSLADLNVVPELNVAREQIAQGHMTSKERYVLSRIDGKRTLAHIAAVSPIQKAELVRIVDVFKNRGMLTLK
jgi:hypothetical protein